MATFPGGCPRKGPRNLILSRDPAFAPEGGEVYPDLDQLLAAAPADSFVVGGASVYAALLPYCDTAYITRIDAAFPADKFFPHLDADPEWQIESVSDPMEHEGLSFRYYTYIRK